MKLSELRIVGKNSQPDVSVAHSLRRRFQAFLEAARTAEPPTNFENPNEDERHIELDIFVPKLEGDDSLQLPLENFSSDSSSDSDNEAVEFSSGRLIQEVNSSRDLAGDGEEISYLQSTNSDADDYHTDVSNLKEAGVDQPSSIIVVGDDPGLTALVNTLTSPEFPVSEVPTTRKRPLIEEISSLAELSSNTYDSTVPKFLKTDDY